MSFRLYLDEHVHPAVGEHLRRLQHEVLTTQEARRPATSDEEQLAFAAVENRVIITYDCADFAQLDASGKLQGGSMPASFCVRAVLPFPFSAAA